MMSAKPSDKSHTAMVFTDADDPTEIIDRVLRARAILSTYTTALTDDYADDRYVLWTVLDILEQLEPTSIAYLCSGRRHEGRKGHIPSTRAHRELHRLSDKLDVAAKCFKEAEENDMMPEGFFGEIFITLDVADPRGAKAT